MSYLACAAVRSNFIEMGASDINPSHDQVGADVALVPEEGKRFTLLPRHFYTVPNLKGDPNYSERGPKGDLILSKKGT